MPVLPSQIEDVVTKAEEVRLGRAKLSAAGSPVLASFARDLSTTRKQVDLPQDPLLLADGKAPGDTQQDFSGF